MPDDAGWVTDTSVYTHLFRAGHGDLIGALAPGPVLVPDDVVHEIARGQERYDGIASVGVVSWARMTTLTDDEVWTQLAIKADMGGGPTQHLGECAVIACAKHRGLVALIDDRQAVTQARRYGVQSIDTLWLVVEAYATLFGFDRHRAAGVVDDLLTTDMYLPVDSGESLIGWAWREGLLPRP